MNINRPTDDPLFDTLLSEALGGPAPPDLSAEILRALQGPMAPPPVILPIAEAVETTFADSTTRWPVVPPRPARKRRAPWPMLTAVATVAVSVAVVGFFAARTWIPQPLADESSNTAPQPPAPQPPAPLAPSVHDTEKRAADATPPADPGQRRGDAPRRRTEADREFAVGEHPGPLKLDSPDFGPGIGADPASDIGDAARPLAPSRRTAAIAHVSTTAVPLEDAAIVARIDAALANYWSQQGLQPTSPVDAAEFAHRLDALFGKTAVPLGEDPLGAVRQALADESARLELADKLAARLLGRVGQQRIEPEQRAAFARWLAPVIAGRTSFDQAVREILAARGSVDPASDDFDPAVIWLAALAGPRSVPLVEQFGHAMLDVDLRCGRCHDHPLDGRVWQDQYWQLSAIFETGLRWSTNNQEGLRVETPATRSDGAEPVVFYELPDGRQRVAYPRAAENLLNGFGDPASAAEAPANSAVAMELVELAQSMTDNPQLARAAVNRVWEVVYGSPLVGSSADPSTAPESPILLELQNELAEQLRAHDFDLGRLIVWVSAAAPMRLSTPPSFQSPQFESATSDQLRLALRQTRCFAGYPQSIPRQDLGPLLAVVDGSSADRTLQSQPTGTLLAQARDPRSGAPLSGGSAASGSSDPHSPDTMDLLRATLEVVASEEAGGAPPAEWLPRIGGSDRFDRQAEHLYYLAGYYHPSPSQLEIATAIRQSAPDDAAALSRLWWVLSNER